MRSFEGNPLKREDKSNIQGPESGRSLEASHKAAVEALEGVVYGIGGSEYVELDDILRERDLWVSKGAIAEREANELPAIREAAKKSFRAVLKPDAIHYAGLSERNISDFKDLRTRWSKAGIVTEAEANEMVKDIAKNELSHAHKAVNMPQDLRRDLVRGWIDSGVLTQEEVEAIAE